jgi:outer membrane receptor protein involved in Fe transport
MILLIQVVQAQSVTVSGTVNDSRTQETLAGVSISVKGKVAGTITDTKGNFSLTTSTPTPFTLVFSSVGYASQEMEITDNKSDIKISLEEQAILGQEVVVAASRVEESVLQSPVTIEKMDVRTIRETPAANFYDALANLKGIDMNTQSLTFRSVNTRGFNANGQVRVVQMVDGMDNQAPGLNFSVGNISGLSELDVAGIEVLPGAASALYGPNAVNGIILMSSKNPFQYQGLSAQAKLGVMHVDGRQRSASPLYDMSVRYAKAFNNKLAFKVNLSWLKANDWQAQDYRNQNPAADGSLNTNLDRTNPAYNGINVYGDENNQNLITIANSMVAAGVLPSQALALVPNTTVSRTGYTENDLVNYNTESLKLGGALHWRINDNLEAIVQGNWGTGTTVYTGADRYYIKGFSLGQYKLELKGSNFFVRGYTTRENSGDSYAAGILANLMNEAWKPSQLWYPQYVGAYLAALGGGQSADAAHLTARNLADQGRYAPGSSDFNQTSDVLTSTPIGVGQGGRPLGGARFLDKTNLYHAEFMYNFSKQITFAEFIVGGNFRQYDLNSEGTLFARDENNKEFNINEYGGYIQGSKKLIKDHLKLTASIRYDKNQNFDGQWSPRASAVYTFLNDHNFRLSFQTGFRIPTTQDQYIDLLTPQARLVGGLPFFRNRYNMNSNPVYRVEDVTAFGAAFQSTATSAATISQAQQIVTAQVQAGQIPNEPAAIQAAVQQTVVGIALQTNAGNLKPYQFNDFQPERVQSYEVGYKGLIANKLFVDVYYYLNNFKNFIGSQVLLQSNIGIVNNQPTAISPLGLIGLGTPPSGLSTRNVYSLPVNRPETIRSQGWGMTLNYALPRNFSIGGNVAYNDLSNEDELGSFQAAFNSPRYRFNLQFGNREVVKNLGFNVTYRWQESFVWQSSFVQQIVSANRLSEIPAFGTFDAQVSYKIPSLKSIVKVGGSNIFNRYYTQAWGNPSVGGLYYISLFFDEFLN